MSDVQEPAAPRTPDSRFYVSAYDEGRGHGLLVGPFRSHANALALVTLVRKIAEGVDPWAHFYAFGTVQMADGKRAGVLNCYFVDELAADAAEAEANWQTFRLRDSEDEDTPATSQDIIFLQNISAGGSMRIVIPPDVANVIARHRDALTSKNRKSGARKAVETKRRKS